MKSLWEQLNREISLYFNDVLNKSIYCIWLWSRWIMFVYNGREFSETEFHSSKQQCILTNSTRKSLVLIDIKLKSHLNCMQIKQNNWLMTNHKLMKQLIKYLSHLISLGKYLIIVRCGITEKSNKRHLIADQ